MRLLSIADGIKRIKHEPKQEAVLEGGNLLIRPRNMKLDHDK